MHGPFLPRTCGGSLISQDLTGSSAPNHFSSANLFLQFLNNRAQKIPLQPMTFSQITANYVPSPRARKTTRR
jgi:hypothetical protein